MNILIVGFGNIGSKLYTQYKVLNPDRYDPYKNIFEKRNIKYDIAFIAVDTPIGKDGYCDLSQVYTAIQETNSEIIVLRSTVPPMTTETLCKNFNRKIIFCPEFYGTTQHSDEHTFDFNFTILGGNKKDCNIVIQALQEVYDARHRFCITDSRTAELAKYMENCMLAAKVSLCIQFWDIAQQLEINYPELRELVLQDPRFNRSHTFVYDNHPYWESHCFDKDLLAITKFANAPLIQDIINFNTECKDREANNGK